MNLLGVSSVSTDGADVVQVWTGVLPVVPAQTTGAVQISVLATLGGSKQSRVTTICHHSYSLLLAAWKVASSAEIHVGFILVVNLHMEGILLLHVCDILLVSNLDSVLSRVNIKRSSSTPSSFTGEIHTIPPACS